MKKSLIILLGLVFFLVGCGEKSTPLKSATFDLGNNTKNRTELYGSKDVVEKIVNVEIQTGIKKEDIDKVKKIMKID